MEKHMITDSEIEDLMEEAALAGDDAQVVLCELALEGDASARNKCAAVLDAARANVAASR